MKLRFTITGPKVHDVGYRPYLAELAMRLALRGFEVYNDDEAVITQVEGDEKRVKKFADSIRTEIPPLAEVEDIESEEYIGDVMPLWQFASLNTASQMNKAVPILMEIRDNTRLLPEMKDDLKEMKGDIKETKSDLKAVKGNTDTIPQTLDEIKGLREDIQPGFTIQFRQVQEDIQAIKQRLGMS